MTLARMSSSLEVRSSDSRETRMHIIAVLRDVFSLELQCIVYKRPVLSGGLRVVSIVNHVLLVSVLDLKFP